MEMRGEGFPEMKSKNYKPKTEQNNSTELFGNSLNNIYNKNDPPDLLDPQICLFLEYSGFSIEPLQSPYSSKTTLYEAVVR